MVASCERGLKLLEDSIFFCEDEGKRTGDHGAILE
jgi:hypothetical protein